MSAASPLAACLRPVRAVVFDTDGVLTDSARMHAAAWQEAFDACLAAAGGQRPFDPVDDYLRHVDGRSRLDGAAAFLASRGLALPPGSPGDAPGTDTVAAVAARKDEVFRALLRERGAAVWPGSVRLVHALRGEGILCAAVSASRHATELLTRAGLLGLFRAVVDGNEAARLGLPGKPDPALFAEAARRLAVLPREAAVVEDATAGVEAGRRGGFGLVVGVDRSGTPGHAAALRRHGADVVVADPGDLLAPGTAP
ncbi:HAD family hydrolase [Streptomyces yunnanensis]|uniref:Haloacid dehalogenase superfamily, subfamily IA, variant 3 with third motif having DD or ED n=1 Tax=Streptomyces yunnanensis TaxID=156453 RepID=A0A9X8N815_9ACTN|nr:HAD-IA family hydrolase [Streptomyces yunnanensis]SHN25659.1 haloacid dehalogenase superfamily, subfamily IA, variant 3 with third motif having DD or ED [Streptomyces yunnanensis]